MTWTMLLGYMILDVLLTIVGAIIQELGGMS